MQALNAFNCTLFPRYVNKFEWNLPSRCIYTLYLMSDSYLGLDQQYDIHLNVTPASVSAQVNSEMSDGMGDLTIKGSS